MTLAIEPGETFDFRVPWHDGDQDGAPTLICRAPSARQWRDLVSRRRELTEGTLDEAFVDRLMTELGRWVTGWRDVCRFGTGEPLVFEAPASLLDAFSTGQLIDLVRDLPFASTLSEIDRKNSRWQSRSNSEASAAGVPAAAPEPATA